MKSLGNAIPATAILLAGCAADTANIQSEYVSPETYAAFDCAQVGAEFARLSRRAEDVGATVDRVAADDQAQAVVGVVLFWPALFFLEGEETAQTREYARLKGQIEALEQVSVSKGCGVDLRQVAQASPPPGASTSLDALQMLYRDGVITEEEYTERRKKITDGKIRQELAALEAQKAAAATGQVAAVPPAVRKAAILPIGRVNEIYPSMHVNVVARDLLDRVTRRLERDERVKVVYATQDPGYNEPAIEDDPGRLWPRGAARPPDERAVYRAAESLGADLAIAFGWVRTFGSNELTVYVFDVPSRRVHKRTERNRSSDTVEHVDALLEAVLDQALRPS